MTARLKDSLAISEVRLLDHLIVGQDGGAPDGKTE